MVFDRLVLKKKPEIVTMRRGRTNAATSTATKVSPTTFRDWIRNEEDMLVIDTRNRFECELGTFRGAVDPQTAAFHEFPAYVETHREELRSKKVVMFCTGGIRCEKATSWMHDILPDGEIFQLDGGILKYFEDVGDAHLDWKGELFVFDQRVAVDTRLQPTSTRLCCGCGVPVRSGERCASCEPQEPSNPDC